MNTEDTFFISNLNDNLINDINLLALDDEILKNFEDYVEVNRQAIELNNLLNAFYFNVQNMRKYFTFYASDEVQRLSNCPESINDYHSINALTTSCISSGKTVIEALENATKYWDGDVKSTFKEYTSQVYDTSFAYRFLTRLRDFAQHGHMPVSSNSGKYCFNLNNILNTPHFNLNKNLQTQMQKMVEEIGDKFKGSPNIAYTLTVSQYIVEILKVYCFAFDILLPVFTAILIKTNDIIYKNPNFLSHMGDENKQAVFYKTENGNAHCFFYKDDNIKGIKGYITLAQSILSQEKELLSEIESGFDFDERIDSF